MKALSLFSGIGGIDLACEWVGIETVAFCEREPFCQRVLRKHWPDIPIYDDVCTLTKERLDADGIGPIELIHGGYPCQPFSHAGQRKGAEDDRHLWPEVERILQEIRPRWFLGENVAGHITLGLDDVLADLENAGYEAQAFVIPASAVGASHQRERVFIVAHSKSFIARGLSLGTGEENSRLAFGGSPMAHATISGLSQRRRSNRTEGTAQTGTGMEPELERCCEALADTEGQRCREAWGDQSDGPAERTAGSGEAVADAKRLGQSGPRESFDALHSTKDRNGEASRAIDVCFDPKRPIEPLLGRSTHELSAWLDGRGLNPLDALQEFVSQYPQPALMGMPQHEWEPPRVASGIKNRTARLKALGNAVDPLQILPLLAAIKMIDDYIGEGQ
ncbi:DNA cytosine methyltransferase [Paenibacillus tyrfis]|uniref:DNA cytosine methyltransferase n=1 Tax=Paenibacillus tyrfis TaxID=1501230 RepID=UPI00209FA81D|nr:DNA (cytosine-5-)-methyltransferase [Paenibacillus tyrfis]MCP1306425.1 DNA (cytosine-5-)-methyltransferase [Paenibacillus tyrfis]